MDRDIRFDSEKFCSRWVGYFDLLGTRDLIESGRHRQVFESYTEAIKRLKEDEQENILSAWFSDTFLIYSPDNSGPSFVVIEQAARWFMYFLINASIPVRGAIACGDFYADETHQVFFGKALIEAYNYGESQDWIGLILTPSAVKQMEAIGLPADERLNYAFWEVLFKGEPAPRTERHLACILGNWIEINKQNPCLEKLKAMMTRNKGREGIAEKYHRTIEFIESNQRLLNL